MAEATKVAIWFALFCEKLKISCDVYLFVQLFYNNQRAISLSKNLKDYKYTKYIDICYHYIRE